MLSEASYRCVTKVLLPAKCFTRTASLGRHHFTSNSLDDLNAAQDVVSRSTSAKKLVTFAATESDESRAGIDQAIAIGVSEKRA